MSVHPQIKRGDSCNHSSPLGKVVVRPYDLALKDGQCRKHTPLDDTGRIMSVSDAVRADIPYREDYRIAVFGATASSATRQRLKISSI